ncbi:MAG: OmpA family protein [Bacteroidetes bacterium]|nr:OmpA family protein [Bacteroidota bacterium]
MVRSLLSGILLLLILQSRVSGQVESYTVSLAPFSSDMYDEYSPVYYKNGIVFCSNWDPNLLLKYLLSTNRGPFNIFFIDTTGDVKWQNANLFSKNLNTKFNDGPVTFNPIGDEIYYSRNQEVKGKLSKLSGTRNKLGIFHAVLGEKDWEKTREFRFNNKWYNFTTPWFSPDENRLYFSSDKFGGYGGADLYYCQWKVSYWDSPVNLGPLINTEENESYPFITATGSLFFSSDGHSGMGGKDIFFSKFIDSAWINPVALDAPINSESDDFGLIADTDMKEGYFSSNRDETIDIYHFKTTFRQLFFCERQRENQYCFIFRDKGQIDIDTTKFQYVWDFGNGNRIDGKDVHYCFPGPGKYYVKLNIEDSATGGIFFTKLSYYIDLRDIEQPYITSSYPAIAGDSVRFDGLLTNLPGFEIAECYWIFGDGEKAKGEVVKHLYKEEGIYEVKLGIFSTPDSNSIIREECISKNISVYYDPGEIESFRTDKVEPDQITGIEEYDHAITKTLYSFENEVTSYIVYQVELFTSETKVDLNSEIFRNIPEQYTVKEVMHPHNNLYSYIVSEEINLMYTYPAYSEMYTRGFRDVTVRTFLFTDPAHKELYNLKKTYCLSSDLFFRKNDYRLSLGGYPLLLQIIGLMNKYPTIMLEVAVHTDNIGTSNRNLALTRKRTEVMVNYLIEKGIDSNRLVARGYGESRPIAPNFREEQRILNRRIDFNIIEE